MREIKFRAYSEQDAIMYRPLSLQVIAQLGHDFSDNIKLMQYTGLKDKNGKAIYEGDIVKDGAGSTSRIWKVTFNMIDGLQFILILDSDHVFTYKSFNSYHKKNLEVIGNIYENPELLRKD